MSLISSIRVAGTTRTVSAEIHPCEFKDVQLWQRDIHTPYILPQGGIGSDWDWTAYFIGCNVTEASAGRQALTFQIRVEGRNGDAVPVAQAILSLPYAFPGTPAGVKFPKRCVFIWYIAAAPQVALKFFGVNDKFATLAPLLDTAIQVSLGHDLEGRIGLHAALGADAQASEDLAKKYEQQGLVRRKKGSGFFRAPFRREDGRLFYFDEDGARAYAAAQDDLR